MSCACSTVDSKKLEHGCRMSYAGCPFSLVSGWRTVIESCSKFPAYTVDADVCPRKDPKSLRRPLSWPQAMLGCPGLNQVPPTT